MAKPEQELLRPVIKALHWRIAVLFSKFSAKKEHINDITSITAFPQG